MLGIYTAAAFRNVAGVANIADNAAVEVRRESDGALADIYADRAGTTPITQPGFSADDDGYFEFFAAGIEGGYRIRVQYGISLDITLRYQRVGTAGEYDATPYGAMLMGAADAAEALSLIGALSSAIGVTKADRVGTMAFIPGFKDLSTVAFECDGAAYSRTTFANLFAEMVKTDTVTISIASPGVVSWASHPLQNGMPVKFTTTGTLPTGLLAGHTYWVVNRSSGSFEVALVPGGSSINTSGTQSGTHTAISAPHGDGDGSTTFNVPDMRDAVPVGYGATTLAETFNSAQVDPGTDNITVQGNHVKWVTGMQVVLSTTGTLPTGLSAGTYFVVRTATNTIKLATSLANAQNGTVVDITGAGSGNHTIVHTRTVRGLGETGGEDAHAMSQTELLSHLHGYDSGENTGGGTVPQGIASPVTKTVNTHNRGGNAAMNITQPFKGGRWIIYHS